LLVLDIAVNEMGVKYNPDDAINTTHFTSRSMGIDPGFSSSCFAITISQWENEHIQILYSEEFEKPDFNAMLDLCYSLMSQYRVDKTYIDGSAVSFIRSLKLRIGENPDFLEEIARLKKEGYGDGTDGHKIVPVNFSQNHKEMFMQTKIILEYKH
jgi:hypothetical protein